jgi:hypothetical protein
LSTDQLIVIAIGAVMIAIGIPLFHLGRYFSAPEDQKKQKILILKSIAIIWVSVGLIIFILNFIIAFISN